MERRQYKLIYKENGWKDGGSSIGAGIRADCYQNRLIIVKEKE